jgi:energy-coupling factor transporter ATP-binding protein EcfA2
VTAQHIELTGLQKTFNSAQGPVRAVRGVDISIERGETVALLGPNGAGKSTTIDMLLGLTRPDGGSVSLFGRSPTSAIGAGGMALVSLALLYVSGASLGVSLPANDWVKMTLLILIGLVPFAALGILIGHLITVDSIGPVMGGTVSLLALVSGTWFPISHHGFLHDLAQNLPSYWLVQASHVSLGGHGWGARGWLVIVAWTVALVVLARQAYRRDTGRV